MFESGSFFPFYASIHGLMQLSEISVPPQEVRVMIAKRNIRILCADADRSALDPILSAMREKGFRISESTGKLRKNETVLAVLSEAFFKDSANSEKLLHLIGQGAEHVLPLRLDDSDLPENVSNALYARNIISASGREPEGIAQRMSDAIPQKKSHLPIILTACAAVLLVLGGIFITKLARRTIVETPEPAEEPVVEDAIEVRLPNGLTEEDLEKVEIVFLISDQFYWAPLDDAYFDKREQYGGYLNYLAPRHMDEHTMHWYDGRDGHEHFMAQWSAEDLAFLTRLPNLRAITMVLVDPEEMPDLSGISTLEELCVCDCTISDLSFCSESQLFGAYFYRCRIEDYALLNRIPNLEWMILELDTPDITDLSQLGPENLVYAEINYYFTSDHLDLSGLSKCKKLETLVMQEIPVSDLSFLSGLSNLSYLYMRGLNASDFSPLTGLSAMEDLSIESCRGLTDCSFLSSMPKLERLLITEADAADLSSADVCTNLKEITINSTGNLLLPSMDQFDSLEFLEIHDTYLEQMDFAASLPEACRFSFSGETGSFEGLSGLSRLSGLSLHPNSGADAREILPYLSGCKIGTLELGNLWNLQMSDLPEVEHRLQLSNCDIADLNGLPDSISDLSLINLPRIRSLSGIHAAASLMQGGTLEISGCPLLMDWDELSGAELNKLWLRGLYILPDLSRFHTATLRLEQMPELENLDLLDKLDSDREINLELIELDGVQSLAPLFRLHGDYLNVSSQFINQAEDLVAEGCFQSYDLVFPEGGWEPVDAQVQLLDLKELETLPKVLLQKIEQFAIAGDTLYEFGQYDVQAFREDGLVTYKIRRYDSEEWLPVSMGSLENMEILDDLIGLRRLEINAEPLENLNGIQALDRLESVSIKNCPSLTDASALFALQDLNDICLFNTGVTSIQGIQNLTSLKSIDLNSTRVTDLTPLADLDSLEQVHITADMKQAAESLSGLDYSFELIVH
jgi:Leucine-rich repeat (LRR) protein